MRRPPRPLHSPQHGADACQQLPWIEGLGDIVVSADFQADDPIVVRTKRGQHDDRGGRLATNFAAQIDTIAAGKHEIEDDKIDLGCLER